MNRNRTERELKMANKTMDLIAKAEDFRRKGVAIPESVEDILESLGAAKKDSAESAAGRASCSDYEEAKDKKSAALDMLRVMSPLIGILAVVCLLLWREHA